MTYIYCNTSKEVKERCECDCFCDDFKRDRKNNPSCEYENLIENFKLESDAYQWVLENEKEVYRNSKLLKHYDIETVVRQLRMIEASRCEGQNRL